MSCIVTIELLLCIFHLPTVEKEKTDHAFVIRADVEHQVTVAPMHTSFAVIKGRPAMPLSDVEHRMTVALTHASFTVIFKRRLAMPS